MAGKVRNIQTEAATKKDGMLLKSTLVMKLKKAGKSAAHFWVGEDGGDGDSVVKDLYMPSSYFNDMGKPEAITITVVPGDILNG